MRWILEKAENTPPGELVKLIDLKTAIELMVKAWDMVTPETVMNCFKACGWFYPGDDETVPDEVDFSSDEAIELMLLSSIPPEELDFDEEDFLGF